AGTRCMAAAGHSPPAPVPNKGPPHQRTYQLRGFRSKQAILKIQMGTDQVTTDPTEINTVFEEFSEFSEFSSDSNTIHTFLDGLDVPILPTDFTRRLEEPISELEIVKVISTMQSNECPGPDGFASEFLKNFSKLLSPLLCCFLKNPVNWLRKEKTCGIGLRPHRVAVPFCCAGQIQIWFHLYLMDPNALFPPHCHDSYYLSRPFRLYRATRQWCPLSPFDLAIEPLAIALRTCNGLSGIWRGGVEHRVSLYAGDLLYVSNPSESIPTALALLNHFGTLSDYKLYIKSELFPINNMVEHDKFLYLGVILTKKHQGPV
uniref:Uncharacterized protein n=1 Tax=Periophthalmus magnuspinnatus TaxID=409849 RepID=A0A3B3ZW30_9GOBI